MAGSTVAILGGGWGGLTAAHHLRGLLHRDDRVVVVERKERFSFCPSYLWLMTGERRSIGDVSRPMRDLARPDIEWLHEDVREIDPVTATVTTATGTLHADQLIVALGAENAPEDIPGFTESAHNVYDADGAIRLRSALAGLHRGRIVVLIARTPFRCPGAPYECALLIDSLVRDRGERDHIEIAIYTPEKAPLGVAGPAVGAGVVAMLTERGIDYYPQRSVRRIDAASRTITFDGEEATYDLLVGVPPHRAPAAVRDSGLTDGTGYVPVHPQTLELLADVDTLSTRYPNTHAIGDVTSIRLLNSLLLPKTGVFAESEARVVAQNVAATLQGRRAAASYDGIGGCYIEVGQGKAAYGVGDFFAYPGPSLTLEPPSAEQRRAKEQLEKVLVNWFKS